MFGILPAATAALRASTHSLGNWFTSGDDWGNPADHAVIERDEFNGSIEDLISLTWSANLRVVCTVARRRALEEIMNFVIARKMPYTRKTFVNLMSVVTSFVRLGKCSGLN